MIRAITFISFGVGAILHVAPVLAQPAPPDTDPPMLGSGPRDPATQILSFEQVAKPTAIGQIVGSDQSFAPQRLPATFAASGCTATLIGPRVLLTAAHCIDGTMPNGAAVVRTVSVKLSSGGAPRLSKACAIAPAYLRLPKFGRAPRSPDDFALCEMSEKVPIRAETLDLAPARIAAATPLVLAGYGCSEASVATNNGRIPEFHDEFSDAKRKLRVGANTVADPPVRGWSVTRGRIGTTAAVICPGDSGGAAYAGANLAPGTDKGWRVVAVNSAVGVTAEQYALDVRGVANPPGVGVEYFSYLSPLSDPDFLAFLSAWQSADPPNRRVCGVGGIQSSTANCRP